MNNIPEIGYTMKSKEITDMETGRDGADIRMWQETGLYWPKIEENERWSKRLIGQSHRIKSVFSFNRKKHETTGRKYVGMRFKKKLY